MSRTGSTAPSEAPNAACCDDAQDDIYDLDLASGAVTPLIHSVLTEFAPDIDASRGDWTRHDSNCYSCGDIVCADIASGVPHVVAASSVDVSRCRAGPNLPTTSAPAGRIAGRMPHLLTRWLRIPST